MERKIGEVFHDGNVTLKVEREICICDGCYYKELSLNDCPNYTNKTTCTSFDREDGCDVIFIKQDQP